MRIDQILVEKGLVESRNQAQRLVMAGKVRVDGQVVPKPSSIYFPQVTIVLDPGPRFVSRGGEKMQAAFDAFSLDVDGKVCADVGASTGGFTDCMLQHGARKVYAIDVGKGILHWNLRNDSRVQVMEGINARLLDILPEPVTFVSVDVSFISLKVILPVIKGWFHESKNGKIAKGEALVLIKPQFEAGRRAAARGKGVIRDPVIHREVLKEVLSFAQEIGYKVQGLAPSPVLGPKGNREFLSWLEFKEGPVILGVSLDKVISEILEGV